MKKIPDNSHVARLYTIIGFLIFLFCVLLWRLVDLTVVDRKFLQGQGNARSVRVVDIPSFRGMILDREGAALAISTPVQSIWVNPKNFAPSDKQFGKLIKIIKVDPVKLRTQLKAAAKKEFLYIKRQVTPRTAEKIENLKIPGLFTLSEFKRYYPESFSAAQLIGFTNIDDNGIEGIELAYQNWLVGINGKKRVIKDRTGRIIDELNTLREPRAGNTLQLSIDRRLQFFAYNELAKTVENFGAKSGTVVVLDTRFGELLAVVNYPSFNPNDRGNYPSSMYRNKAFTDAFEPGSIIKPFSVASALDTGKFTPDTVVDTRPSWMVVNRRTIRDVHNYGLTNVTGVLSHSSNVGVSKLVLESPPEQLTDVYLRSGFGHRTDSGYPGENEGVISKVENHFVLATLSFGYGLSVTAIQIARAYLIFANHGRLIPISLIKQDQVADDTQVIKPQTADKILAMLEETVENGTGIFAKVPGYRVAGKTGTARIASGKHGYANRRYISSFVGIAPVSEPRLIVAVFIKEPTKNNYYGALVAGPLFAKIMGASLRILDVPHDKQENIAKKER